ncbi:hypothetical protein F443_02838 [Phytophthora nicotianae P1569]|uniref:Uncharacterized protein n=1 Tax=Phytophthora nicotianae P1569 TaxID=1317065 RepID=V9FU81_PHYNI|nr:hypothetical protein F443_02838 [Phytophthora nicotianae P1569]
MAKEKGMSVKDVLLEMVGPDKKCGFTTTDGPCELYIDDKMVLHSDDCESDYPGGPNNSGEMSVMPADYSSCNGNASSASTGLVSKTRSGRRTSIVCLFLEVGGGGD